MMTGRSDRELSWPKVPQIGGFITKRTKFCRRERAKFYCRSEVCRAASPDTLVRMMKCVKRFTIPDTPSALLPVQANVSRCGAHV